MDFKQTYSITRWEIYNGVIILYDIIARYAYEMINEYYSGEGWEGKPSCSLRYMDLILVFPDPSLERV